MYGGLLLTAAGFALGMAGALRLYGVRVGLPLGCLVLLALPPVWDFATSGLETGLATCWLAGGWLLLVSECKAVRGQARSGRRSAAVAVVLGLGPLVRPDLGLVSVVFLGTHWLVVRPGLRGTLAGAGAAALLPGAYEVFRAGYYGHLVPLPAVSKEASQALWRRGLFYAYDFVAPYVLWLPVLLIAACALALLRARAIPPSDPRWAVAAAPLVAGVLSWLYVVRVGGDFMHARMLLPGLLLMLLPVFAVPVSRTTAIATAAVAIWAVSCACWLRVPYEGTIRTQIADERGFYVRANNDAHPVRHTFAGFPGHRSYREQIERAQAAGQPTLVLGATTPLAVAAMPHRPPLVGYFNNLGWNGHVVPLSGTAIDRIGLGYPLAAHSQRVPGLRVGHDKALSAIWMAADNSAIGSPPPPGATSKDVAAARRALHCGPLAELQAAVRDPLTPQRFWRNLTGAWERTRFRFPGNAVAAEQQLCHTPTSLPSALRNETR